MNEMTTSKIAKEIVSTNDAPKAIGPYSQAVKANGFLFISGCLALCPKTNDVKNGSVEEEAIQAFENLSAVLKAANSDFDKIVKVTVFIRDMSIFQELNEVYARYVPTPFPARTTVAVKELPLSLSLEVDVIATYDE